jgi:transposase
MLGISKRGNRYVRRLLAHGARSCVNHLDRSRDRLGQWIGKLQARVITVALAAKIARIAWVIMTRPGALYERCDPSFV